MWRNYLTVAFRALAKSKVYAAINIVGLALGLAACVMILLYVRYETSYDSWLKDADRVYQVQTSYKANPRGGEAMDLQLSSIVTGRALRKDYPSQIEKLVWVRSFSPKSLCLSSTSASKESASLSSSSDWLGMGSSITVISAPWFT